MICGNLEPSRVWHLPSSWRTLHCCATSWCLCFDPAYSQWRKQRITKSQLHLSSLPCACYWCSRLARNNSLMSLELQNPDWRETEPCGSPSCRESISSDRHHSSSKRHEWLRCAVTRFWKRSINVFINYMQLRVSGQKWAKSIIHNVHFTYDFTYNFMLQMNLINDGLRCTSALNHETWSW